MKSPNHSLSQDLTMAGNSFSNNGYVKVNKPTKQTKTRNNKKKLQVDPKKLTRDLLTDGLMERGKQQKETTSLLEKTNPKLLDKLYRNNKKKLQALSQLPKHFTIRKC